MKITKIIEYLRNTPKTHSVIFLGKPGIGKTEMVRKFAEIESKEEGRIFLDFHEIVNYDEIFENPEKYYIYLDLRMTEFSEPSEILGIPRIDTDKKYFTYEPPVWARILSLKNISGLIFLDELTNVQRDDIISAVYKLVLDRKVGFLKLSDNVRIIAAGNTSDTSEIVRDLPRPLRNRFEVVKVSMPSIEDWKRYMDENYKEWDRRIFDYLLRFPDDFYKEPKDDEENFPTPRSWTRLAIQTKDIKEKDVLKAKAISLLGKEVGMKVYKFLSTKIPSIRDLLRDKNIFKNLNEDEKYLLVLEICKNINSLNDEDLEKIVNILSEDSFEWVVLLSKICKDFSDRIGELKRKHTIRKIFERLSKIISRYG